MTTPIFPILPNGAHPIIERFEFLTDVNIALDGTEISRTRLRAFPRRIYKAGFSFFSEQDRTALAMIRTGTLVKIPLFPLIRTPGETLDAGMYSTNSQYQSPATIANYGMPVPVLVNTNGVLSETTAPALVAVSNTRLWQCPYAEARFAVSREFSHVTSTIANTTSLDFELSVPEIFTTVPYESYNRQYIVQNFRQSGARHNWAVNVTEKIDETADIVDYGHVKIQNTRYLTRTLTLDVTLNSRAAILAFRRFVHAVAGRAYAFKYAFQGDQGGDEYWRTPVQPNSDTDDYWRLATDTIEIVYINKNFATCKLEIIQLNEASRLIPTEPYLFLL